MRCRHLCLVVLVLLAVAVMPLVRAIGQPPAAETEAGARTKVEAQAETPSESPAETQPETHLPLPTKRPADFARDIRPIFQQHCYECHGEDTQESGLRLDVKQHALDGSDNGKVILPGNSAASRLIRLTAAVDPDAVMPPESEGLSSDEVALLRSWIDAGAPWPKELAGKTGSSDHWAFQPRSQAEPPGVVDSDWVRNPIDAFVLARLESKGLTPSAEASRETLIRRLYLDLWGLPPTPQRVEEFVADTSADAYERLVDELLASPHYGERFARHWLDLARYADSDGYEKDLARPYAWRYRDWVINALNADMPFDQFTVEQLAGDLLPEPTAQQLIATGFHRNTLTNREGGVDQEEYRDKANVDRVNTTGSVWLGLTLGCAQCHSHKFDPIPQREYFSIYAFFNSAVEKDITSPLPEEQAAYVKAKARYDARHQELQVAVDQFVAEQLPARLTQWEASQSRPPAQWQAITLDAVSSLSGATLAIQEDGSVLASGTLADKDQYRATATVELPRLTALRLEVLPDESLPGKGPGRHKNGNFVLTEFRVDVALAEPTAPASDAIENAEEDSAEKESAESDSPATGDTTNSPDATNSQDNAPEWQPLTLTDAAADYSQKGFDPSETLDKNAITGWAVADRFGQRHVVVFRPREALQTPGPLRLRFRLDQQYGGQHTIGRFRISVTDAQENLSPEGPSDEVVALLHVTPQARTESQQAALLDYYKSIDPELGKLRKSLEEHAKKKPQAPQTKARTMAENAKPPVTHVHTRGDFLRKGEKVEASFLSLWDTRVQPRGALPNRLDLAQWLIEPENPLTSRVVVNRAWAQLFGRGLVATLDDFGTRGEAPSHPQLLDWLAGDLIREEWSMKRLHRMMVTSATYCQTSRTRDELVSLDPNNTLLARQNRFRVEAEVVRDLNLAVSGLLEPVVGGPSVRPPLPKGVSELGYANSVKWKESEGADRYRRGLYIFFQRTVPYPMLLTFDAPDGNVCATDRDRSNTPLQALTLLNDPVFFECAQAFGRRITAEGPDDVAGKARFAYRTALAREATEQETEFLCNLFEELRTLAAENPAAAEALVGSYGEEGIPQSDAAAWVGVGRTLLNLDAFVTRE
jgi:mono/diheme cytochrome c family protein